MDRNQCDRLHGLIASGFSDLREAIVLAMDLNEDDPGARVPGGPTLPVILEQLSFANRILAGLVESLPAGVARAH